MALCGARTDDGTPCENPVRSPELRCWKHGGPRAPSSGQRRTTRPRTTTSTRRSSASRRRPTAGRAASERIMRQAPAPAPSHWQQPAPPPPPPRHTQENERVKQAAIFCADSLSGGWQAAVAQRITDNAPTTWKRLSRSGEDTTATHWHRWPARSWTRRTRSTSWLASSQARPPVDSALRALLALSPKNYSSVKHPAQTHRRKNGRGRTRYPDHWNPAMRNGQT